MLNRVRQLFKFIINYSRIKSLDVSNKADISNTVYIQKNSSVDAQSKVGQYTYIGKNSHITKGNIGNYCSIANNVSIGHGEHDLKRISTSTRFYENTYEELTKENCSIGHDVWVGVGAVILRGVRVGNGAVIGANAVVTKDVPDFAIVVGVPARVIRYRFDEVVQTAITNSCWWEKSLDDARMIQTNLNKLIATLN